jgi:hypothetical protein
VSLCRLPPSLPACKPTSLSLWLHSTSTAITPPAYLSSSLGHCIIAFDDFHSLSIANSSDTGTLVKAEHFHPLSQPSFLSNRPRIPNTSINNQGCVSTERTNETRNKGPHRSSKKNRHRPLQVKGSLDPLTFVQLRVLLKICVEKRGYIDRVFI